MIGMLVTGLVFFALPIGLLLSGGKFDFSPNPPATITQNGKTIPLIPGNEVPDLMSSLNTSAELVEHYPRDPRSHMFRGLYFMRHDDLGDAERELRMALGEADALKKDMPPDVEQVIRIGLSVTLDRTGHRSEGVAIARPICGKVLSKIDSGFRGMFERAALCGQYDPGRNPMIQRARPRVGDVRL